MKKKYEAPMVEMFEARVENGFVASSGKTIPDQELVTNSGNVYYGDALFN